MALWRILALGFALAVVLVQPSQAISLNKLKELQAAADRAPFAFTIKVIEVLEAPDAETESGLCRFSGHIVAIEKNAGARKVKHGERVVIAAICWGKGRVPVPSNIVAFEQGSIAPDRLLSDHFYEAEDQKPRVFSPVQ